MILEALPCPKAHYFSSFAGLGIPMLTDTIQHREGTEGGNKQVSEGVDVGQRRQECLVSGPGLQAYSFSPVPSQGRTDPRYWELEGHLSLLEPKPQSAGNCRASQAQQCAV